MGVVVRVLVMVSSDGQLVLDLERTRQLLDWNHALKWRASIHDEWWMTNDEWWRTKPVFERKELFSFFFAVAYDCGEFGFLDDVFDRVVTQCIIKRDDTTTPWVNSMFCKNERMETYVKKRETWKRKNLPSPKKDNSYCKYRSSWGLWANGVQDTVPFPYQKQARG